MCGCGEPIRPKDKKKEEVRVKEQEPVTIR